ncbi:MAG: hypothetical protein ACLQUY_04810 [Ktedonobacterales bacterium]
MERILLLRDKDGTVEACLQGDKESESLCVQLTSESEGSAQWPVLEEQEIYLSAREMDRLVRWWQELRRPS